MTITSFNKQVLKSITNEMISELQEVANKHGISIKFAGGNFSAFESTVKLNIAVKETETGRSAQEEKFKSNAIFFGFKPSDYKKKLIIRGSEYELIGFNHRAKKYPVLMTELSTGKTYKFPVKTVEMSMA